MAWRKSAWHKFPEIYVRLHKDELGYPPREWEQLKAQPITKHKTFRIKSVPFYAKGLAYDDEVSVTTSKEGYSPVFDSVVRRSGFSTMRLWISPSEDRAKLIRHFNELDTLIEFNDELVALGIPRDRFDEVSEYVCDQKDNGRWDAEDGFLIIDA